MAGKVAIFGVVLAALVLSGCANRSSDVTRLHNLRSPHDGPDEFAILPVKPLSMPSDLKALPQPEPGARNLVDPNPMEDAVAALGGRPGAGGGDPALVAAATRGGIAPDIRETLAEEDLRLRQRRGARVLERLFRTPVYARVYRGQSLDRAEELERFRAAGARTSALPEDR
jgi:hypothetical protein